MLEAMFWFFIFDLVAGVIIFTIAAIVGTFKKDDK